MKHKSKYTCTYIGSNAARVAGLDHYHRQRRSDLIEAPDLPAENILQLLHSLRLHMGDDVVDPEDHVSLLHLRDLLELHMHPVLFSHFGVDQDESRSHQGFTGINIRYHQLKGELSNPEGVGS